MVEHINKSIISAIIICFFISESCIFAEATIQDHTIDFETLYDSMKTNLENEQDINELSQEYVGKSMGISKSQIQEIIKEDPLKCGNSCLLSRYCQKEANLSTIIECKSNIQYEIQKRKTQLEIEQKIHNQSLASQAFMNGTLQDTQNKAYDLVVDFNIIDLLLFGEKASVPSSSSPFFPSNNKTIDIEEKIEEILSEENNDSSKNTTSKNISSENTTEKNTTSENESNTFGFCMNHNEIIPTPNDTPQDIQNNEDSENFITPSAESFGNIVDEKYKYQGGIYPDIKKFKKNKKCKAGEKSFFYGRICIPEFCNENICIKINLKAKSKPATELSPFNCTECHIDRGNEALNNMIETLGQNTPNVNPMEPYFLRAIGNLFKNITSSITLIPKPLPFLVYDEALIADKKNETKIEEEKKTEKNKERENKIREKNEELYRNIILSCPEGLEYFSNENITLETLTNYCKKVDNQATNIAITKEKTVDETKNDVIKNQYEEVLKPFEKQISDKIIIINTLLQEISSESISKTNRNCKTTLNQ